MASDGIEKAQERQRGMRNCFVGRERVMMPDRDSERQLGCTDLRLCWG
jgi:hypothetical protein